ncbi:unnamed protein product [Amoebophrya sp. A25]|nr:unnamed protein product [Amoebophrya sp. A25]|eukprot:GSA25T00017370001.1
MQTAQTAYQDRLANFKSSDIDVVDLSVLDVEVRQRMEALDFERNTPAEPLNVVFEAKTGVATDVPPAHSAMTLDQGELGALEGDVGVGNMEMIMVDDEAGPSAKRAKLDHGSSSFSETGYGDDDYNGIDSSDVGGNDMDGCKDQAAGTRTSRGNELSSTGKPLGPKDEEVRAKKRAKRQRYAENKKKRQLGLAIGGSGGGSAVVGGPNAVVHGTSFSSTVNCRAAPGSLLMQKIPAPQLYGEEDVGLGFGVGHQRDLHHFENNNPFAATRSGANSGTNITRPGAQANNKTSTPVGGPLKPMPGIGRLKPLTPRTSAATAGASTTTVPSGGSPVRRNNPFAPSTFSSGASRSGLFSGARGPPATSTGAVQQSNGSHNGSIPLQPLPKNPKNPLQPLFRNGMNQAPTSGTPYASFNAAQPGSTLAGGAALRGTGGAVPTSGPLVRSQQQPRGQQQTQKKNNSGAPVFWRPKEVSSANMNPVTANNPFA